MTDTRLVSRNVSKAISFFCRHLVALCIEFKRKGDSASAEI
jgi:hypothetical protein